MKTQLESIPYNIPHYFHEGVLRKRLLVCIVFILLPGFSYAYQFQVQGYLTNPQGEALIQHEVRCYSWYTAANAITLTDQQGFYQFSFEIESAQEIDLLIYTRGFCKETMNSDFSFVKSSSGITYVNLEVCHQEASINHCQAEFIPMVLTGGHILLFFNTSWAPQQATASWDFGNGFQSVEWDPTHHFGSENAFVVNLQLSGPAGCTSSYQRFIMLDQDLGSEFTVSLSSINLPQGEAFLFQPMGGGQSFFMTSNVIEEGKFRFWDNHPTQSTLLLIPEIDAEVPIYPTYLAAYYEASFQWQQADFFSLTQASSTISLPNYPHPYYGLGSISGKVTRLDAPISRVHYGYSLNSPIPSAENHLVFSLSDEPIPCILYLIDSVGDVIAFAKPNSEGDYQFNNLPAGDYQVRTEIFRRDPEYASISLGDDFSWHGTIDWVVNESNIQLNAPETSLQSYRLYPQPASDYLQVESVNSFPLSIQLFHSDGRFIQVFSEQASHRIALSQFNAGIYYLKVKQDSQIFMDIFIKL